MNAACSSTRIDPARPARAPLRSSPLMSDRCSWTNGSAFTLRGTSFDASSMRWSPAGFRRCALESRALARQLDSYIERIVTHDLSLAGLVARHSATVLAWMRAYAAATGTTASWEKIRQAATTATDARPAKTTTLPYIELLSGLRILDPVRAWSPANNHLGVLSQSPRHYLADPALAARLVRRSATRLLGGDAPESVQPRDGGFLGGLFENLAGVAVVPLALFGP